MRRPILLALAITMTASPVLAEPMLAPAELLAATAGHWAGELQYRDYETNQWQGLPVKVAIVSQPDGVTTVRTAAFDDGPKTGTVWITTLVQVDPKAGRVAYAGARKGRALDSGSAALVLASHAKDGQHWVLIETELRQDGGSMAQVRETTTRDGDSMITLKEVNPVDDSKDEWLPRNRTVLTRVRPEARSPSPR